MDCVYHHLSEQIEEWQNPETIDYSPQLAKRILGTFEPVMNAWDYASNRNSTEEDKNPALERHITNFIGFNRELLGTVGWSQDSRTAWPDSTEANKPNAGWQYLHDNAKTLGVEEGDFRMSPVTCFLDWGYCIWDGSRLEEWQRFGDGARQILWGNSGQGRVAWCAHCEVREDDW